MILPGAKLPRVPVCNWRAAQRRLPNQRVHDPLRLKGPPQLHKQATNYALPPKRQEIRGQKKEQKPVCRHCALLWIPSTLLLAGLIIGYSIGDVSGIQMFNLNVNVRVVCRDNLPGLLPDAIYVWNISLLWFFFVLIWVVWTYACIGWCREANLTIRPCCLCPSLCLECNTCCREFEAYSQRVQAWSCKYEETWQDFAGMHLATDKANRKEKESTHFRESLAYTTGEYLNSIFLCKVFLTSPLCVWTLSLFSISIFTH